MTWIELLLTAVALSMDAFAVSTCKGLNLREMSWKRAGIIGLFFGGFQALMRMIGSGC
jgi:putative Mn2+ efflux pump MntP